MRDMIKMIIVLTLLSCFSGGVLAYLRNSTQERIDNQVLEFVKGPAVRTILEGASNNPIADRFTLKTHVTNTPAQALDESLGWVRDEEFLTYDLNL